MLLIPHPIASHNHSLINWPLEGKYQDVAQLSLFEFPVFYPEIGHSAKVGIVQYHLTAFLGIPGVSEQPQFPVIANVTAEPEKTAAEIRANLENQLISPVQWTRTIQTARGLGIEQFYEVGTGKVLSGLVKRIDRAAPCVTLGKAEELNALVV